MTIYITLEPIREYDRDSEEQRVWDVLNRKFTQKELQNCEIEDWDDKGNWVIENGKDEEIAIDEMTEYEKIYGHFAIVGYSLKRSKVGENDKVTVEVRDEVGGIHILNGTIHEHLQQIVFNKSYWSYKEGKKKTYDDGYKIQKTRELVENKLHKIVTSNWEEIHSQVAYVDKDPDVLLFLHQLINL